MALSPLQQFAVEMEIDENWIRMNTWRDFDLAIREVQDQMGSDQVTGVFFSYRIVDDYDNSVIVTKYPSGTTVWCELVSPKPIERINWSKEGF